MMSIVAGDAAAQVVSRGTAFSVAPELLITNQHVVKGCSSVDVISPDGRRTGSIAAADADIDLAILHVSELKGTTARLREPTNVLLGEPVLVFGYPLADRLSSGGNFTSGVISALRGLRDSANQLQITSPVQPGNSGGPLMDSSGLVIGVIQSKLDALGLSRSIGDIPQNVNFAVSLEALTQFLAKHKIDFLTAARSPALDTARVAEMAQNFTHRIECKVSEQRASPAPNSNVPLRVTCPGNPNALGVSRILEIDTTGGPGFGFEHFKAHDFLREGEVVLTFDDGPWPKNTPAVLAALAAHCTKAIFFPIGLHATYEPGILKQVAAAGHAIGSHTWCHQDLSKTNGRCNVNGKVQPVEYDPKDEIEKGISAVRWAVGAPTAPYFRFPALRHTPELIQYLGKRNIAIFSTDLDSFDFKMREPEQVRQAVMAKLKQHGKGIVLLHDFQKATAEAAMDLLNDLKSGGYNIVFMKPKFPVTTIASYDEQILKLTKGPGGGDLLECAGFKTVPTESVDRDPVVKSSIHLYKARDEKPTGFEVKHETLKGETYARNDQYRDLRFWSDRNGDYWSGVSVKNPQRTMVGQLAYDPTISARRYIEKSFIGGKLDQTTTSICNAR
jgi:peptidoglycan/xylan/chitin deacetylase (PgdA/CDA1 family)